MRNRILRRFTITVTAVLLRKTPPPPLGRAFALFVCRRYLETQAIPVTPTRAIRYRVSYRPSNKFPAGRLRAEIYIIDPQTLIVCLRTVCCENKMKHE